MPITSGTDSEADYFGIGSRKIEHTGLIVETADGSAKMAHDIRADRDIISTAAGEPVGDLITDQNIPS